MLRIVVIASIVFSFRVALADADSSQESEPQLGYGVYLLIPDLGSLGVMGTGAAFTDHAGKFVVAGLVTYTVGGPIVHVAHRQYGRAAASLAVRVGMPLVGLLVGDGIQQLTSGGDPHPWEEFDGPPSPWWALGLVGGFVGASLVDAQVIAGGYRPKRRVDAVTWAPTARASHAGVSLGVVGQF
jgi:hypothetical protein